MQSKGDRSVASVGFALGSVSHAIWPPADPKGVIHRLSYSKFGFGFGHFSHRFVDSKAPVGFASCK
jgi:hypothetical protein